MEAPSDEEIMREQEEKLKAKYGGMKPKKKLIQKDVKYFDSADWALQQVPRSRPPALHSCSSVSRVQGLGLKVQGLGFRA